jgi:hypothetical protein
MLIFKYPERYNLNDRRLWSEIACNIVIKDRINYIVDVKVVITVVKKIIRSGWYSKNTRLKRRRYFKKLQLIKIANTLLNKYGFKDTKISNYEFIEQYSYNESQIKIEFLPLGDNDASTNDR